MNLFSRPLFYPLLVFVFSILAWEHWTHTSYRTYETTEVIEGTIKAIEVKNEKTRIKIKSKEAGTLLLTLPVTNRSLNNGDEIRFTSKIKNPRSYKNPGVFNYAYYLYLEGISGTCFLENPQDIEIIKKYSSGIWETKIKKLKKHITRQLVKIDEKNVGILLALLWGDESRLTDATTKIFRDNGLMHLLVISGMHFSAVTFVIFQLIILLLKLFPTIFLKIPGRKIAAAGSLVVLTLYFSICESSPSLFRGYIGVACFLIALMMSRELDALNILFLAALVILGLNPYALFSLSFQFSFLAVLSLLTIFPRLTDAVGAAPRGRPSLGRHMGLPLRNKFLKYLSDFLLLNLSLLIGLTPLMLFNFHTFQWVGPFMNLWAVPFIELLIVPIALTGLVFSFIPFISKIFFTLALYGINLTMEILQIASDHLPPPFLVYPPHTLELIVYYLLIASLIFTLPRLIKKSLIIFCLLFFVMNGIYTIHQMVDSKNFTVNQIDVGQGDSILVELPNAKRMLVDGGGSPYFDIGENVLIPYLLYKRIPQLDVVVITHADTDHYLGLKKIVETYTIGELWWNGKEDETKEYQEIFKIAGEKNIKIRAVHAGDHFEIGEASIDVLNPPTEITEGVKDNNLSIVLRINAKNSSALLTGDLESLIEKKLAGVLDDSAMKDLLNVDLLKVGHHGSKTSSSLEFLQAVSPKVALIGVGENNRFHHPHVSTIDRLNGLNIPIYRTDENGEIEAVLNNGKIKIRTFVEH